MSAIFISHSSKDSAVAAELKQWLDERGLQSLFLDFDPEVGIPAGRNWEQELYRQLRACQAVIVLCSEHSMASDWCFVEITHARALGKHIFPLRIAPCKVRPPLTELQVVDAITGRETAYERLLQGLRRVGLENLFAWDPTRPPYPGLMAFQEPDAAVFFGREADIRAGLDGLNRVRRFGGARLLVILGASGSGKSSLLRAGLLPRLRQNPDTWLAVATFRPLQRPIDEMAMALARTFADRGDERDWKALARELEVIADSNDAAAAARLVRELRQSAADSASTVVVPVDQFEETLVGTEPAARFLRLLGAIANDPDRQAVVVATLRSDFLAVLQTHPLLQSTPFDTLAIGHVPVEGLVQVIEGPAAIAGLEVESGLTQLMLADVETEDSLPLLAFTLRELWECDGKDGKLSLATYRDTLGGLNGAVARAAEGVLAAAPLSPDQEEDLRASFLAMVRINEAGQYMRQAVRWSDLPARVAPLLERFVAARLLVSGSEGGERILEVAHEALFRVWKRARAWLDADRDNLRLRESLRQAAREWDDRGRPPELLVHRGSRLEAAEALAQLARFPLEPVQRDYLQACLDAREAERAAERRRATTRTRIIQATIASLAVVTIVVSTLGVIARNERRHATERLASLHWVNGVDERDRNADDLKALHHFMQAAALEDDGADARNAYLAGALLAGNVGLAAILQPQGGLQAAAFGADSMHVVTWSSPATARVWDTRTQASQGAPLHEGAARKIVASPRGRCVVLWFGDDAIEVRDNRTGRALAASSRAAGLPAFSDDETRLAIRESDAVSVFDVAGGRAVASLKHPARVLGVVLDGRGQHALTWDDARIVRFWDVDGGRKLAEFEHGSDIVGGVIGGDSKRMLVWGKEGSAKLLHIAGQPAVELGSFPGLNPAIMGAAFLAKDNRVVTWNHGAIGAVRIWDGATGREVAALRHDDAVRNAIPNAAETLLLTWSDDETARVWSAEGGLRAVMAHERAVRGALFSPDETSVLTWSNDGSARVWDAANGEPTSAPMRHEGIVQGAAFAADGLTILTWDAASARVWRRLPREERRTRTLTHREAVVGAGFAAPNGIITTLTQDGRLHRWAGNRPEPTVLALPRNVVGGAFDGEGKRILGWRSDHLIGVWSTDDGRELVAPMRHERSDLGIQAAVWSRDGSRILSWGDDRTARIWDARAGKLIALLRHPSTVSGAALSDDQTRAITWSVDRIVRLWDVQQQAPTLALPAHEYGVRGAALTRDNGRILSWDANGSILLWDARNGALLKTISRGAGFPVRGARFTSDEQRVLAWGEDAVRIWDIGAGSRNVDPILWNAGNVQRAAFNADERIVLTTGDEGARLWSSRSGQPLTRWLGSGGAMQDALLSRDERTLLAWADGSVHTWNVAVDTMPAGQDAVLGQHARTGTRLGRTGDVELMPTTEWQKLRERFALPPADAPIN